jgi:putative flippase GtrA
MRGETLRLLRFGAVGVSNTALTVTAFALLSRAGVGAGPASALAFALGAANGYLLNRSWTFGARGDPATLLRYVAVQALGALLSGSAVALASEDLELRRLAAELVVLPLVTLVTYTLCRRVVFTRAQFAAPR